MKNLKHDNRGLTLVEVMVAIAISVVVIGAIWQFMLISTRTYDKQKSNTDLQQEVQQTMNQIENLVIDADRAVKFSTGTPGATLEIYSAKKICKLIWNETDKTLTYTETPVNAGQPDEDATESAILAKGVEAFSADVSKVESDRILKVSMTFERKGKTYEATRNITLRNMITVNGVVSEIYKDDLVEETEIKIVITNPVGEEGLDPGASHVFQATVTGADDTSIIWTIPHADSEDTSIDILTGKLIVGMDENTTTEVQEDKITVIATLKSNREISATTTVSINPPPPVEIIVEHFPDSVIYGESYPIKATTEPAGYSINWSVVAGSASVNTSGTILTTTNKPTTKSDTVQVKAQVVVDNQVLREKTLEAKVRHPEFSIVTTDYKNNVNPAKYDRGSQVNLSADWSNSYTNSSIYTEDDDFYGHDYVKYANGGFTNETINWTAWYTLNGKDVPITVTKGVLTLPINMNVSRVYVKGTSSSYPYVTSQKALDLATPTLTLKATMNGSAVTGTIPFGKTITLQPEITGVASSAASYDNWGATGPNGSMVLSVASNKRTASFKLTDTQTYKGKSITVTVKEQNTGLVANLVLKVSNVVKCNIDVSNSNNADATYEYIFANGKKVLQNPFFVYVDGMKLENVSIEYRFYTKTGNTLGEYDYEQVMKFYPRDGGILCEPRVNYNKFNYDGFSHIIIHIDDKHTGEHIAMYKLVPVMSNYERSNVYYRLPYTKNNLNDLNKNNHSGTANYVNFYGGNKNTGDFNGSISGYPKAVTYTYNYVYSEQQFSHKGETYEYEQYDVTITPQGKDSFTKTYTKWEWDDRWDD